MLLLKMRFEVATVFVFSVLANSYSVEDRLDAIVSEIRLSHEKVDKIIEIV